MINKTTALVAGALILATPSLAKDSYDYSQHNLKVKTGNIAVTYRDHADLDKWMAQVDYKIAYDFGVAYRYQESKGDVEHRFRLNTPNLVKLGGFSTSARVEWREFDKESKDDSGNVWLQLKYKHNIGSASVYAKVQPKFAFDNDKFSDGEFYTAQNAIGVDYKLGGGYSVGVYVEQNTDEDWKVQSEYIGTNISYKF
jgi:hypothetical protein